MERAYLENIEAKLNDIYGRAASSGQLPEALEAIRGLMQLVEMREGQTREVGFGGSED